METASGETIEGAETKISRLAATGPLKIVVGFTRTKTRSCREEEEEEGAPNFPTAPSTFGTAVAESGITGKTAGDTTLMLTNAINARRPPGTDNGVEPRVTRAVFLISQGYT